MRVRRLWLLGVASVVLATVPQAAVANDYGPEGSNYSCSNSWCYPEGAYQRYWYDDDGDGALPPTWVDAMDWTRGVNLDPTEMNTDLKNLHDNSDVASYHKYWDTNWAGLADCIDRDVLVCLHWHLKFNTKDGPYDYLDKLFLACHESGHSAGLHHREQSDPSCLTYDWSERVFDSHDEGHINDYL